MTTPTDIRYDVFFEQLALCGLPAAAARAAGCINASNYHKKRAKDPEFAAQWQAALDEFAERIEGEAFRRAVQGVCRPVVYKGDLTYLYETDPHGRTIFDLVDVGEKDPKTGEPVLSKMPRPQRNPDGTPRILALTEYSDSLLLALLKAKCVGYKDKVEISNAPGEAFRTEETPIQVARQVAFALALGLKEAERLEASGEDLA
jgi:hypothetical protein